MTSRTSTPHPTTSHRRRTARAVVVAAAGAVLTLTAGCAGTATPTGGSSSAPSSNTPPSSAPGSSAPSTGSATPSAGGPGATPGATAGATPGAAPGAVPGVAPPPDTRAVPAARVDAHALPARDPHQAWTSMDGRTVVLRGSEGGCERVTAAATGQDAKAVHITMTRTRQQVRTACTMDLRYPVLTVPLAAPLGERTVVLAVRQVSG